MRGENRPVLNISVLLLMVIMMTMASASCQVPANTLQPVASSPAASTSVAPYGGSKGVEYKRLPTEIPVRDGSKLAADVYIPQKEGKYPAIVWMTPYNKDNAHPSFLESIMGVPFSKPVTTEGLAPKVFWQTSDYVIVVVDWRGRGTSVSLKAVKTGNPHQNGLDGYDVIEWVASQPWCTGKVGMWGSSAGGVVQFEVAATRPPHLACITPAYANFERSYESYYQGGVERKEYLDRVQPVYANLVQTVRQHPLDDGTYDNLSDGDPKDIDIPVLLQGGGGTSTI